MLPEVNVLCASIPNNKLDDEQFQLDAKILYIPYSTLLAQKEHSYVFLYKVVICIDFNGRQLY